VTCRCRDCDCECETDHLLNRVDALERELRSQAEAGRALRDDLEQLYQQVRGLGWQIMDLEPTA
jgi:hypothetical protein